MEGKRIYTVTSVRYGFTNFCTTLLTAMASTYFALYLNSAVGLTALAAGSIISVGGIVDTVSIPLVGVIIQKTRFKAGMFRPWLLIGGAIAAVFSWLRFTDIGLTGTAQYFYYVIIYGICYVGFNFAYTSFTGLMPVIAKNPKERVSLSAIRVQLNTLSHFLFGLISVYAIAALSGGESNARGYSLLAVIIGVFVFFGFSQLHNLTKGMESENTATETSSQKSSTRDVSFWEMLKSVVTKPMILYLIATIMKAATFFSILGLAGFHYTYVVGDRALFAVFLSGTTLLMFAGAMIAPFISNKIGGGKNLFLGGNILFLVCMLGAYFARGNGIAFTAVLCLAYFVYALMHSVEQAIFVNIMDYTEYKTGKDVKGFLMSLFTLAPKVGTVIQGVVLGVGLTAIGFSAENVTQQAINGIPILMSLLPAALLAIGAIAIYFFPLDDETVLKMQQEIEARKS